MCPIDDLTASRKRKHLALEEFDAVLAQFPYLERLDLEGIGEPLLNPHLAEMVERAQSRGIAAGFVTNGTLLDATIGGALIKAGLSCLVVSLDSADPAVFESIREGATFHEVTENIKGFVGLRKTLEAPNPWIGVMMVAMNVNINEMSGFIRFVHDLGVDGCVVKGLNPAVDPSLEIRVADGSLDRIRSRCESMVLRPGFSVKLAFLNGLKKEFRCRWPWSGAYVTAEGDVTPCCNCPDPRILTFGNLFRQPFRAIWNGDGYKAFRSELKNGVPQICRACPDWSQSPYF
jgi:radical SAM protein with 4Fe4S-binding SPASM domain